ncbi:MAG: NYN domain-containing protein [Elainellaceae cyanobacterium]
MARSKSAAVILMVDGYNVIGACPSLKMARDRHGLETARRDLVNSLIEYSAYQGYETEVVFDAQYSDANGTQERLSKKFRIYYTDFNQTADTYIEKVCAQFRNDVRKLNRRLMVATSDRAQQLTVVGYGAECMSALQLLSEIESARQRVRSKLSSQRKPSRGLLSNSIDPVARQRLSQMRFGMKPRQP